jgi:hypothetical protein
MRAAARLLPAVLRFVWEEAIRSRHRYFSVALLVIAAAQTTLAGTGTGESAGPVFMIGLWVVSAPLCRAWLDADLRRGYAAFWLQKPILPTAFYLARLAALVVWSSAATVTVLVATAPSAMFPAVRASDLVGLALAAGWMPPLLVVLSFFGSAIGAGNATLFAFALLFGGLAFPGLSDALSMGPAADVLQIMLPPAGAGLDAIRRLQKAGVGSAVLGLWPLLVYGLVCTTLGLTAALRLPARLVRLERD